MERTAMPKAKPKPKPKPTADPEPEIVSASVPIPYTSLTDEDKRAVGTEIARLGFDISGATPLHPELKGSVVTDRTTGMPSLKHPYLYEGIYTSSGEDWRIIKHLEIPGEQGFHLGLVLLIQS